MFLQKSIYDSRRQLGRMLNDMQLLGTGVEIGTHRGEFAQTLLQEWKGERLFCVDHWQAGYDAGDPASHGNRREDYETAKKLLLPDSRTIILRLTSVEASQGIADGSLDFVYIDACHQTADVLEDLNHWWPKVKRGGVLAGHDIVCPHAANQGGLDWGETVQPAVFEFFKDHLIWLLIERYTNQNWSYYVIKE